MSKSKAPPAVRRFLAKQLIKARAAKKKLAAERKTANKATNKNSVAAVELKLAAAQRLIDEANQLKLQL